jgi:hypothetical protein
MLSPNHDSAGNNAWQAVDLPINMSYATQRGVNVSRIAALWR